MALIDRMTRRLTRACLFVFWLCILLAAAWCAYIGFAALSSK
jgi:hypothetical protein